MAKIFNAEENCAYHPDRSLDYLSFCTIPLTLDQI